MPTTVHLDQSGKVSFGDDADDFRAHEPAGYIRRIKRHLGSSHPITVNGQRFTAEELITKFLAHVRMRLQDECLQGEISHAVITVPARFGPAQKADLKFAAERAGFPSVELLDEPVAAGLAFLREKEGHHLGSDVLVFDWGGGTLDIALVEMLHGKYRVNEELLDGDPNLGGEDIDDALIEALNDQLRQAGHQPIDSRDSENFPRFYRTLIDAKVLLSRREEYEFRIVTRNHNLKIPCTRSNFEEIIEDPLSHATRKLEAAVGKAKENGKDLKAVLLVGGSSQIPAISRFIRNDLRMEPIKWARALEAVSLGAALAAAGYSGVGRARDTRSPAADSSSDHYGHAGESARQKAEESNQNQPDLREGEQQKTGQGGGKWHYPDKWGQDTVFSEPDFQSLVAQGQIKPETLVWRKGMAHWRACSEVRPDLFVQSNERNSQETVFEQFGTISGSGEDRSNPSQGSSGHSQFESKAAFGENQPDSQEGKQKRADQGDGKWRYSDFITGKKVFFEDAKLALVSVVCGVFGFACLGILFSPAAVICGHLSRAKLKQRTGSTDSGGIALVGLTLGYIGTLFSLLWILSAATA
ncbi:MAG: Hsp70 family protein [Verrucomicrobiales bacterium]